MIQNGEGRWNYFAVKKLSVLLRGVASENNNAFFLEQKSLKCA